MRLKILLMLGLMFAGKILMANPAGTYGIHLFFNESEYVDVMKIEYGKGLFFGQMHVPNDFDGPMGNIKVDPKENTIEFELKVPKNQSRPKDLIFYYKGKYFDSKRNQIIGYVTLKGSTEFVASFVAFKRVKNDDPSK